VQFLKVIILVILFSTITTTNISTFDKPIVSLAYAQSNQSDSSTDRSNDNNPFIGVNVRGYYPSMSQARGDYSIPLPLKYYEESFKILSEAGMNHIRYRFYWESYVRDPFSFINELVTVAQTADRFGIKVLYDNHQYHTSSWLDPQRGTGFPSFLFEHYNSSYPFGSGGDTEFTSAQKWWTSWWNRSITDTNGNDGWILQAEFLKKVVNAVDNNTSTLGYEILNEPQIHHKDQWDKVGKYNTFITDKLREITQRTIAYDMNIPVDLDDDDDDSQIDMTPKNLAKMAPSNKANVIFKFSVYGIPEANTYQGDRLDIFVKAAKLADVPLYVGEWNNLSRERVVNEQGKIVFQTIPELSDINQTEANFIVQKLKEIDVWGMAYWNWSFLKNKIANYNLITITTTNDSASNGGGGGGKIQTTKYFDILKNAYSNIYG
jgi:hypothetical protein